MSHEKQNKNIICIDESGISSNQGNSVFVLVYIHESNYENISKNVVTIENDLHIPFIHWSQIPWRIRVMLAKRLVSMNISVRYVRYKNPILPEKVFIDALRALLHKTDNIYKIIIDGKKNNVYKRGLKKILRDYGFEIKILKIVNDTSEPLVRVADFVAGFIRYYLDNKDGQKNNSEILTIYQKLKNKIEPPI